MPNYVTKAASCATTRSVSDDFSDDIRLFETIDAVPSILEVVCQATGMRFAAVARVTQDRWVACAVRDEIEFGLVPGGELEIETTICKEILDHREPVIIDNVAEDQLYSDHHTPDIYGLQSYISMPIVLSDGSFYGTLCAIDPNPAEANQPHIIGMFRLFAGMIADHIEASRRAEQARTALIDERETSALREQFIAVLGHDLRNPLAGIQGGMLMLEKEQLSERGTKVISLVNDTVTRMAGIVDNVMDFARGRLGGGVILSRSHRSPNDILSQVVAELGSGHPEREIVSSFDVPGEISADHGRIGQLFSNLLANALTHGDPDQPVRAEARLVDGHFEVLTVNGGTQIPSSAMERLFTPFARGEVRPDQQGLGLGLYIASQIAKAHRGTLTVASTPDETVFTFRMPL